jgi:hypothetical protein
MDDKSDNETTFAAAVLAYEAPVLTPIGTLGDLLAGGGSNLCDGAIPEQGPDPASSCGE